MIECLICNSTKLEKCPKCGESYCEIHMRFHLNTFCGKKKSKDKDEK